MNKIITLITTIMLMFSLVFAQDIEAEVDVVVDSPKVRLESMIRIVEKRVFKLQLSNEEKQKLMNKLKETLENTDLPKTLLCVELCKSIETDWSKQKSFEYCIKNIEQIQNRTREHIKLAKQKVEKLQAQLHHREKNRQAVEALQNLLDAGIPVEHALDVVTEAIKSKGDNIEVIASSKILKKLEKGKIILPVELQEQVRAEIRTQMQLQQQISPDLYQKMQENYNQISPESYQKMLEEYQKMLEQHNQKGKGSTDSTGGN